MLCCFRLKVVWNSFVLISCLRSFVLPSLCDVKNYKGQGQTFVLPTYDLKECHQKWPHQILETQWRLTLNAQSKWSNQRLGNRPLGWKWRRDTYNMTLHRPESCTQKWSFFHQEDHLISRESELSTFRFQTQLNRTCNSYWMWLTIFSCFRRLASMNYR